MGIQNMKRIGKRGLELSFILLLWSASTWADRWQAVAISEDHSAWLFLDMASIKRYKGTATARIMLEYADDQPGIPETDYVPYISIRSLLRFDCIKRRLLSLEEEYLDGDEGFLGGSDLSGEGWGPVISGSLVESAFAIVCKKRKATELTRREEVPSA